MSAHAETLKVNIELLVGHIGFQLHRITDARGEMALRMGIGARMGRSTTGIVEFHGVFTDLRVGGCRTHDDKILRQQSHKGHQEQHYDKYLFHT